MLVSLCCISLAVVAASDLSAHCNEAECSIDNVETRGAALIQTDTSRSTGLVSMAEVKSSARNDTDGAANATAASAASAENVKQNSSEPNKKAAAESNANKKTAAGESKHAGASAAATTTNKLSGPHEGETPLGTPAPAVSQIPENGEAEHHWGSTWAWEANTASTPTVTAAPTASPTFSATTPAVETHPQIGEHALPNAANASEQVVGRSSLLVTVEVTTMLADYADTQTGVSVAFKIDGQWTEEALLCKQASYGEVVALAANLSAWPSSIRLKALGPDAFGYASVKLRWGSITVTVLSETAGKLEYGHDSPHWIDNNEDAPISSVYDVPEVAWRATVPEHVQVECTTREDERAGAFGYTTSPVGTPCVFGVDPRDEGSHCILDEGQYGSYGWCYTSGDANSWGSCSETCPLTGPLKVIGDKINEVKQLTEAEMLPGPQ